MDNLIFEKTATHAILSATAFLVLFGFLFFLQTSSCNKAYRNSLLQKTKMKNSHPLL
jgi:hypothetical protein